MGQKGSLQQVTSFKSLSPSNTPSFSLTALQALPSAPGMRFLLMNFFILMTGLMLAPLQASFRVLVGLREGQITLLRSAQLRCPINNYAPALSLHQRVLCCLPGRDLHYQAGPRPPDRAPESHINQAPITILTN